MFLENNAISPNAINAVHRLMCKSKVHSESGHGKSSRVND